MDQSTAALASINSKDTTAAEVPLVVTRSARGFWIAAGILLTVAAWPLIQLARFSLGSQLYSHIVLIPVASAYFAWIRRAHLPALAEPDRLLAGVFGLLSVLAATGYVLLGLVRQELATVDRHALAATAVVAGLVAISAWFLGRPRLRALAFPLGFLVFLAPIPSALIGPIETFLQHGSAAAAYGIFQLSSTPVYRDGLLFILPGFSMQVAPQCSGIHSSLALFITSVAGGYLFLRRPWKRVLLAAAVIPLALVRNGFRVFVIGELCVRISPDMIHSWVHRQGGPLFFALSLIPFSILLFFLYRSDHPRQVR